MCTDTYNYAGGAYQAKITVDYGGSSTTPVTAYFYNPNGSNNCYFTVRPIDGPRAFYCNFTAFGTYTARAPLYGNTSPVSISISRS